MKRNYIEEIDLDKDTPKGKFDIIFAIELLEHLTHADKLLKSLKNLLNKNGMIIVSLPNEYMIVNRLKFLLGMPIGHSPDPYGHKILMPYKEQIKWLSKYYKIENVWKMPRLVGRASILFRFFQKIFPRLFSESFVYELTKKHKNSKTKSIK
jgi:2-polyprenyl-3-methyl-5-hydroxy-6-metoxy-1,4-benzoquinol methylase